MRDLVRESPRNLLEEFEDPSDLLQGGVLKNQVLASLGSYTGS